MARCRRPLIIHDCLDNRVVTFHDHTTWELTKKLSEKPWEGSTPSERAQEEDWQPSEAHAVYECVQIRGSQVRTVAIMKIRIEVPFALPPSDDPQERGKAASGMRLNGSTQQEIQVLEKLTAAGCSVTPSLLAVKVDVQDASVLNSKDKPGFQAEWGDPVRWWMPGGYIVYILMTKLQAQSLDISLFWNEQIFTRKERDEVRNAFRKTYLEVRSHGVIQCDTKLDNLMWDRTNQKCYMIDMESVYYDPGRFAKPVTWTESHFFLWGLARTWGKPNW